MRLLSNGTRLGIARSQCGVIGLGPLAALRATQFLGAFWAAREQGWHGGRVEGKGGLLRGARQFIETGRTRQGALLTYPTRQKSLGVVANPLVEQHSDLATNVSGVVQAREFKALEGCDRSIVEKIPRRVRSYTGYGAPRSQLPVPHIPSDNRGRRVARRLWKTHFGVHFLGGD